MGSKVTRVFAISSLFITLIAFQNCAKTNFTDSSPGSLDKASLTPMDLGPGEENMANVDDPSGDAEGSINQNSDPSHVHGNPNKDNPSAPAESESSDSPSGLVACILIDHGKSLKLGLIQDKLDGVNSVAQSVCISRSACLIDVNKVFPVEGAYDRGYCAHNPNVVRLTDAELAALLQKVAPAATP